MKLFFRLLVLLIGTFLASTVYSQNWTLKQAPLMTRWADDLDIENLLPEYPRPQMERADWLNLNGVWEFQVGEAGENPPIGKTLSDTILVPFPVESALSGVMEQHEHIWYRRTFSVPEDWDGKQILLHFGAIDWESEIFINGKSLGIHQGGYDEISYNISPYLVKGIEQELLVRVYDPTEAKGIPRGKQETPPHNLLIMYTPVTGIWQTVWMEPVENCHIDQLKMTPDIDNDQLKLAVFADNIQAGVKVVAKAFDNGKIVATVTGTAGNEFSIPIKDAKLWSPKSPFLYDLTVELVKGSTVFDKVDSYFGMRKVSIANEGGNPKIFLNNEFVYNLGFLDQGYWPDGIYTAPTDEALKFDVQIQKDFGYNMVRKHLKVERQRWYYWADKLGIMVWQDMPSANSYRHNPPPVDTLQYRKELERMIDGRYNSPSITTWVIYNETQGQKDENGNNLTGRMVELVRSKDSSRLINPASDNIFKDYVGDILDYHSYPSPRAIESETMATACGEFGSVGFALEDHEWMPDSGVSMIMVNTAEKLEDIYEGYIQMLAQYKSEDGMSGAVFTQLTDVEQEINGFLSYDRVSKVDIDKMKKINEKLIENVIVKTDEILPIASNAATVWKYTFKEPAKNWTTGSFDDASWELGQAGFGHGNIEKGKVNTNWDTDKIWLRKSFEINQIDSDDLFLKIMHDEDFEVHINGVLAASGKGHSSKYELLVISDEAKKSLKIGSLNTIAVYCKQTVGNQFIDVGIVHFLYRK
ncbi:glycoside hydrolase family 2 protein [Sunxiuqinia sp. A32]|uniref:glycoside hydrolase family 2 protein n=1 Tax=Sunxiuqinia sp. A32 TaxID=3461496 RepID=UPI0040458B2E